MVGGSRAYVERAAKGLTAVHVGTPVRALHRTPDAMVVRDDGHQTHTVDRAVVATHADEAWLRSQESLLPVTCGAHVVELPGVHDEIPCRTTPPT